MTSRQKDGRVVGDIAYTLGMLPTTLPPDMRKLAFLGGAKRYLQEHGLMRDDSKPSTPRRIFPWAAGGLGALLAYKLMRKPRFSNNPILRSLQENASKGGFHRVVDIGYRGWKEGGRARSRGLLNLLYNRDLTELGNWWQPMVTREGEFPLSERIKYMLQEDPSSIPIYIDKKTGKMRILGKKPEEAIDVKGVVANRHQDLEQGSRPARDLVRGGLDMEGDPRTLSAVSDLGTRGKAYEAEILKQHAPESIPETLTDLREFYAGLPQATSDLPFKQYTKIRQRAARELQRRFNAHFGKAQGGYDSYALKPVFGLQSQGHFPLGGRDWAKDIAVYDTYFHRNPKKMQELREIMGRGNEGLQDLGNFLVAEGPKGFGGLEAPHMLSEGLANPGYNVAQRWIPNFKTEYRVNVIGGKAPRHMIVDRNDPSPETTLELLRGEHPVSPDELAEFAEGVVAKLPPEMQGGSYGFDVGVSKRPDKTYAMHVVEMNPHEVASPTGVENQRVSGGGSGFWETHQVPFASLAQYKHVTGRHALPVALGGALATGVATTPLAYGAERLTRDK